MPPARGNWPTRLPPISNGRLILTASDRAS
ncbi:MAG: hypothetical protein JO283_19190 [Bradyrhizobium sp.]|nr:hypothetical protein [Bradyrhizobium sp.]